MPRVLRVFFIILAICAAFLLGVSFGGHYYRLSPLISLLPQGVRSAFFPGDNLLQVEREVENILKDGYYHPVNTSSLETGALNGMVGSLGDPYSQYFSPNDYQTFEQHTQGELVGVGVLLEMKDGKLTVISTLDKSPAKAAGMQAGDVIVAVDGKPLAGKSEDEAATMIRGKAGTQVKITVSRGGRNIDFNITRAEIEIPVVSSKMLTRNGKKIGYVRLEQFSVDSGDKLRGAVDNLVSGGAQGVILDLRNNGGGLLDESVKVASIFIQKGPIVSVKGRDGQTQEYDAQGNANQKIPLVVLVNGYTASASEIVSGALKDDGRAKLVGEKTFGKGVVQTLEKLSNGGALKFTSGSYYTPKGININKVGIQPDVQVANNPATPDVDSQLDAAEAVLVP